MDSNRSLVSTCAATLVLCAAAALIAAPASARSTRVSYNWSGIAVTESHAPVTPPRIPPTKAYVEPEFQVIPYQGISAQWVEPTVDCPKRVSGLAPRLSIWVGLTGSNLEQAGTFITCNSRGVAQHSGFWEIYTSVKNRPGNTQWLAVRPGDTISANVEFYGSASGGTFVMSLQDQSTGLSTTPVSRKCTARCLREQAEWIVERAGAASGYPLANYGTVPFTEMHVVGQDGVPALAGTETGYVMAYKGTKLSDCTRPPAYGQAFTMTCKWYGSL